MIRLHLEGPIVIFYYFRFCLNNLYLAKLLAIICLSIINFFNLRFGRFAKHFILENSSIDRNNDLRNHTHTNETKEYNNTYIISSYIIYVADLNHIGCKTLQTMVRLNNNTSFFSFV